MGLIIKDKVQYGNKSGTVRFDRAQSLTEAQQAQARDNIGAVSKAGDMMTGPLFVPGVSVMADPWQFYRMLDANGVEVASIRGETQNHRIVFREIAPGAAADEQGNTPYEDYFLPAPTSLNGLVSYDVLTSKTPVAVPQGGTGAIDAATARTNLGITPANIGLGNVDNTSDADKPISTATQTALNNKISTSLKGTANGVAELDGNGKVPTSQLPSYVDDVLEYSSLSNFPLTGESGKIYVDILNNKTYRWSGSVYVEISPSLALGETSSTAYRGDRGKAAYDHAAAKGSAFTSGLYKITTNAEGHVTAATLVAKSDITALGIPSSDTLPNFNIINNDTLTISYST